MENDLIEIKAVLVNVQKLLQQLVAKKSQPELKESVTVELTILQRLRLGLLEGF